MYDSDMEQYLGSSFTKWIFLYHEHWEMDFMNLSIFMRPDFLIKYFEIDSEPKSSNFCEFWINPKLTINCLIYMVTDLQRSKNDPNKQGFIFWQVIRFQCNWQAKSLITKLITKMWLNLMSRLFLLIICSKFFLMEKRLLVFFRTDFRS